MRGSSDAYGSWKTICISRRSARISLGPIVVSSWPWNLTEPDVGSMRRRMQRPTVDLPRARLAHQAERLDRLRR